MIKRRRKSNNTLKWVMGLLLLAFLLLILASKYFSAKFKPIARRQLKELVLQATDSLYRIEFSDIDISLITGGASIRDVKIIPDTNVYKSLIRRKKAPNNMYFITLHTLGIRNFHPGRLIRQKKLQIGQILFDSPDVVMINRQFDFNEARKYDAANTPYHYISKYLKELRVNSVDLKNISFKYINNNLPAPEIDSISKLNITLKDWLIDSLSATDKSRLYLLKDIIIQLNDYSYATPDSMYHIKVNQLDFRGARGQLFMKSLSVVPRYSEMQFGQVAGYARDRFNIQMSEVSMEGINLPLYVRKQELYAKEMSVENGFIEVFNNNALPKREKVRIGKDPHQLLQKLKAQLTVGLLNLKDVDVSYSEFDAQSRQSGKITFEKTSGSVTNITNAAEVKRKSPYMFVNLNTLVMGAGKMNVKFRFDLMAPDGAFSYSGKIGAMDGDVFNRITRPLGMVEVKRGEIKSLDFEVKADDRKASGKMEFRFKDLSVALLKKEKGKERLVKKGFMSILANAMVINSANPDVSGKFVTAPIRFERVKTASFFSFIWRSLFQGIKYSVGVTPAKESEIKAQIAKFEKIKADREKRRAERERRRASGGR